MILALAGAFLVLRYGAQTPQGRMFIEGRLDRLDLGRIGRLRVEGVSGDVWRSFTIRRLTISDAKGVWLQADNLAVDWTYGPLLTRRLQVDHLTAGSVSVLRRPVLAPPGKALGGLPLTFDIRSVRARMELLPAFSVAPGLYDVAARLVLRRNSRGQTASVEVRSLLHAEDSLSLQLEIAPDEPVLFTIQGQETRGGALAGALGLPADRPFSISMHAKGSTSAGRMDATVVSGSQTPVDAHGGWTAGGGVVAGRVSLGASNLTAPYVRMFGPEAVAAIAARSVKGGLYGVAGLIRTQNLTLAVQGPIDPKTQRSDRGLQFDAVAPDLSRLAPRLRMGSGRLHGLVTGSPSDWRVTGALTIDRVAESGLQLAAISGPLTVSGRNQEIAVQTSLAGTGGSGQGPLAALAGPSPHLALDLLRLSDGRVLIRSAQASGAGVKLSAAGQRGLFGALDFKGGLQIANLAAARAGAAGSLQATWSASQAAVRKPWLLTADGRGQGLKTGLGELDRLLGPAPRLKLDAAFAHGVLAVADASLDGDKAAASARGEFDPRGPLALKTQWRAEGPFQVGPVQISGKASGQGAVTGTLFAPRADLTAEVAAIDIPQLPLTAAHLRLSFAKDAGDFAIDGDSAYGPARARSAFRLVPDGVDLSGLNADAGGVKASGALSLRGSTPSSADLRLAIGPGAVLTQGEIGGTVKIVDGAEPSAAIDLTAKGAAFRAYALSIGAARLTASGPLSRLPFQVSGDGQAPQGPVSFSGSGTYDQAAGVRQISFDGSGKFRQVEVHTLEPVSVRMEGADRSLRARLRLGGGQLNLDAHATAGVLTASGTLQNVDVKAVEPDFAGKFDADFSLKGHGSRLDGVMNARLDGARSLEAATAVAVDGSVKAVLEGDRLAIDAKLAGAKGMTSTLSVALPVEASAAPLRIAILRNRPIQGRFAADGEVQPLWDLFYGSQRQLAGQVHLAGTLGGDLADPQVTGQATVAGGRFDDYSTGLRLNALQVNADLKRDVVTITGFDAKDDKGGAVSGAGSVSLVRGGGSNLKLDLTRFRLLDNDTAQATATGRLTLTRAADGKVRIAGALDLDHAQINAEAKLRPSVISMDVVEKNRPERLDVQASTAPARGPPVALDVTLQASSGVFVKGRGLNAELSLDAHVTGDLDQPTLAGTARIVRGSYDFAGKRFDFDESGVIILASDPEHIRLDLSATWEQPSLTATIQIKGVATKPQITMTSSPSLPQDEILSQVLFGASASQLSGSETAQLASTVTSLATGGGFDVLGSLRQFAGLDRLALGGDQTSGTTVAGGKYVGKNVYIEIVGGSRLGPSAEVDWRIRRGLSIVSQIGGEFGAKLAVRWSHDLGKARKAPAPPGAVGG